MSSKSHILKAIRKNRPEATPLPHLPEFAIPSDDLFTHFNAVLESVGGTWIEAGDSLDFQAKLSDLYPDAKQIVSQLPEVTTGTVDLAKIDDPHTLAHVDLAILPGKLAIAENAAIWVSGNQMGHRVLPFITQHLVLAVPRQALVWNMHQAYERIELQQTGFGLFISGPSKTADIEQSLVIGAHGARSLRVVWIGKTA